MAIPSYDHDLVDIDLCEAGGKTWAEPTATGWTQGAGPASNDDDAIQGSLSMSKAFNAVGVGGMMVNNGAGITLPTDGAFLGWFFWASPSALYSEAEGGIRMIVGSSLANFLGWIVGGSDSYAYGGWVNFAVNTTITPDYTVGTGLGNSQYCGAVVNNFNSIFKGSPFVSDAYRYGRCEARISGGETANYATFAGFAAANDALANRWGLIQAMPGGYLWKGLMTLGYGAAVDFRDANTTIIVDGNVKKVTPNFNKIEIRQEASRVDWTNIIFLSLSTASKGRLEVVDDCDVNILGCVFTDMDTFIFKPASDVLDCTFRRCNTIAANDAKFAGTLFDTASVDADTSQLIWNVDTNPSTDLAGCTFTKGANAHHAIGFGTSSPTAMTLTNMTFTGFNASNGQNDSALHIKRTGGTVTITLVGTSQPSYKSDGALVEFITGTRTIKVIAQTATGTKINQANVFLATGASGNLPYKASVTIDNEGTTATVTHTSHGMVTNDKVWIDGASLDVNNGVFTITKINDNSYSYTLPSAPGSDPTGTITATFVYLKGLTDADGEISMQRAIPGTQLANGWARKSSGSPHYKAGAINGNVSSSENTTLTATLGLDE